MWNLRFAICNPEGHAFVPEGLYLDRSFTANSPDWYRASALKGDFNVKSKTQNYLSF